MPDAYPCEGCGRGRDVTVHACAFVDCEYGPDPGQPRFTAPGPDEDEAVARAQGSGVSEREGRRVASGGGSPHLPGSPLADSVPGEGLAEAARALGVGIADLRRMARVNPSRWGSLTPVADALEGLRTALSQHTTPEEEG